MNPLRSLSILSAICATLLLPALSWADSFPRPTVEFSADITMAVDQEAGESPVTGKLYYGKTAERREIEMEGQNSIMITKRDKQASWVLMPEQKAYIVHRGNAGQDLARMMREGKVKLTKLRAEAVNGQPATKYQIDVTDKEGGFFDGFIWLTKENIPVRMDGLSRYQGMTNHLRIEHTNVKIGKQNAALFEIPSGYKLLETPPLPTIPQGAINTQGMTKEQREQVESILKEAQQQSGQGR